METAYSPKLMCASIYQKPTEKTLILSPREHFQRPFNFDAWSEIRLGFFLSRVAAANDNAAGVNETFAAGVAADQICIGLKTSADLEIPGTAGCKFVGVASRAGADSSDTGATYVATGGSGFLNPTGWDGVTRIDGSGTVDGPRFPSDPSVATGYCGFYGLRLQLADRGLATQSFTITSFFTNPVAGNDYSPAALVALMNALGGASTPRTLAWNTGAAARTIPDALFFRWPFYNNRARISCMRMRRYA